MNKQIAALVKRIEKERDAIAKHRDNLRDLLDEIGSLDDSATRGVEALDSAIDALSELA